MKHVEEAVEEELRRGRKYPPGVRLMLDMARAGTCGQPREDRERLAPAAQATGEWSEDRASSDAFLDLADVLRDATDDGTLCAGALAEAWRRTYPFRRPREGDPYDVLLPHCEAGWASERCDAAAVRALDHALALPRPPLELRWRAVEIDTFLNNDLNDALDEDTHFDRVLALGLLGAARQELEKLAGWCQGDEEEVRSDLLRYVNAATAWVQRWQFTRMDHGWRYVYYAAPFEVGLDERKPGLYRVFLRARRALVYMGHFAAKIDDLLMREKQVERYSRYVQQDPDEARFHEALAESERKVAELQRLFPEYLPEVA